MYAMLASLSSTEFDEWFAYYQQHPFAYAETRQLLGEIAAGTYNSGGRYKQLKASDFLQSETTRPVRSAKQQVARWKVLAG